MLVAQGNDQLLVGLLLARLVEDAHVRLAAVEGLGSLAEAARKTVVHQSQLQDALERVLDRQLALGSICRDLNLGGDLGSVVFYVRLSGIVLADVVVAGHVPVVCHAAPEHSRSEGSQSLAIKTHHLEYLSCRAILEDFLVRDLEGGWKREGGWF